MAQILVVDDSSTVRDEVGDFLKANGLSVALAVDGRDGLVKLKADPGIKLILCDVNMPNMDGISLIKAIRSDAAFKFLPIVMLPMKMEKNIF